MRDPKSGNQYRPTYTKRSKGIDLAKDKLKREDVEQMDESLDSIAKKHDMKYTTTAYGAGMKHPTKGEISINRYGEWHHKGTNKTGDSENDFSSLDKHLSTVKEEEQMDEAAAHGYKLKLIKTTHPKDVTDDQDEPVKAIEKHYEVHQNDKKVGNILHHYNDYGGHFYDADLHGKKVPYDRSKGGEGAHSFLKSVVNTKFHSNLKREEVEQMDEVKLADLPRRMVKGTSYGANYVDPEGADDADDKKKAEPKRKSGPQGTMKRRFIKDKSKLRMQYK